MKLTKVIALIFFIVPFSINAETCGGADGMTCCSDLAASAGNAGTMCVTPANNKYSFTLKRFGFEAADGTITWAGTETTFNAASASVGAAMGSFVSGQALPIGTYVAVRPEVKTTFTVNTDSTSTSNSVACSSGGDQVEDLATSMTAMGMTIASCDSSPNADMCDLGDGFLRMRDTSMGDITITAASSPTITFSFDVGSGALFTLGNGTCTYSAMGPMDVSMTLAN